MKKNKLTEDQILELRIKETIARFPALVKEKARRYKERKKFINKTFGKLIKQLDKELAKPLQKK